MVGWFAHADSKTHRRTFPSGRIAHAHTEAGGVSHADGMKFLQIQPATQQLY